MPTKRFLSQIDHATMDKVNPMLDGSEAAVLLGQATPLGVKVAGTSVSGAPTHSADKFSLYADSNGVLYINTSSPSPGTTWTKVGGQ